jgi:hypothetical protein
MIHSEAAEACCLRVPYMNYSSQLYGGKLAAPTMIQRSPKHAACVVHLKRDKASHL